MEMIESEKILENKLKDIIKDLGGLYIKLLANYIKGLPDRVCLLPGGILFFAEIKTTKQKPEKMQQYIHSKLKQLGFKVFVIDNSEDLKAIKNQYDEKERFN